MVSIFLLAQPVKVITIIVIENCPLVTMVLVTMYVNINDTIDNSDLVSNNTGNIVNSNEDNELLMIPWVS